MLALAVAALILAASRGYGDVLLAAINATPDSRAERELLALGLGLGALAYLVLGLGLIGALSLAAILALLAPGLALSLGSAWGRRNGFSDAVAYCRESVVKLSHLERALAAFIALAASVNLLAALAPPTGVDPLVYHLAAPQLYLLGQRIDFIPGNYYANQPFTVQMLYVVALAFGADSAAQVLHWALGLVCVSAVLLLGRRWFRRPVPLVAAALFYAISDVMVQSSLALADLGAAAFYLLAALVLFRWLARPRLAWLVLAGLFAGLFAASRLTNPVGVVALAALLAVADVHRRHALGSAIRAAGTFSLVAFSTVLPWYLKSWALAGNPFYPFLFGVFGGRDLLPEQAAHIFASQYFDVDAGYTLAHLLVVPWTLTFTPERLHSGQLGPLYLGLLPLALLGRQHTYARWLLILALLFIPLWFWSYPRLRTLLPMLAFLGLPLGLAWSQLAAHRRAVLRALASGAMALWLAVSLIANVRYHGPALAAGIGMEGRDAYLARVLPGPLHQFPWYLDFQSMNARLPADARVMIWDTRGYYLRRATVWARALVQVTPPEQLDDHEALLRQARRFAVTHLAVPREPLRDTDMERLRLAVGRAPNLVPELDTEHLVVYRLPEPVEGPDAGRS